MTLSEWLLFSLPWLATLASGTLAGIFLGGALSAHSARRLPEMSWTLRQQAEDELYRRVMPPFLILTTLLLAVVAIFGRYEARSCFAISAVLTLGVILLAVIRQVPLNKEIGSWTAGSAPENWTTVRDEWLRRHRLRSIAALGAFGFATAGALSFAICRFVEGLSPR
ncbi:MAG TPA: DUF1772 domain-containing protein [Acidobacteriaceae bacterium]|nr:DUF1772 domain-containing protein [Acidobacteriaceae bacterium]